jgi:hypothetical protein
MTVDRSGTAPTSLPHTHEAFSTTVWDVPEGMQEAQIEAELDDPSLLRAKGFVVTENGCRLIQLVGRRIEWSDAEPAPDPRQIGRVILIRRTSEDAH